MTYAQVLAGVKNGTLTDAELKAWIATGPSKVQEQTVINAILHSALSGDNKGNWISQIENDLKRGGQDAISPITNPIKNVTGFLTNSNTWVRGGEIVAGFILLAVGLDVALKGGVISKASHAVVGASKVAML